jgi:nicotinate-nucleotide pyrophosphorylase (carboxylating)
MNNKSSISLHPFLGGIDHLIDLAIIEDVGSSDVTTDAIPHPDEKAVGRIVAKEPLVIAGLDVAKRVFEKLDNRISFTTFYTDGDQVPEKQVVAEVNASVRSLLIGERTALNFLQRLSGIATHVRNLLGILGDKPIRLVDTRKTIPGWRILEKYAVKVGGAHNHRMGLFDGVLIKDNHIVAFGGISKAIHHVRNHVSHLMKIEVEVSNLEQLHEAIDAGADIIMLDNMDIDEIKSAVSLTKGRAVVEVSGRIDRQSLARTADAGVDIISMGALTHSAVFVDISMKITPLIPS